MAREQVLGAGYLCQAEEVEFHPKQWGILGALSRRVAQMVCLRRLPLSYGRRGLGKGVQGEKEEAFPITSADSTVVWHNPAVAVQMEGKQQAGEIFRVDLFNSVATLSGRVTDTTRPPGM